MIPKPYQQMHQTYPDLMQAYESFGKEAREAGPLSPRKYPWSNWQFPSARVSKEQLILIVERRWKPAVRRRTFVTSRFSLHLRSAFLR